MVLSRKDKQALGRALERLDREIRLLVFTDDGALRHRCRFCEDTVALARDLADASDKVSLYVYDIRAEPMVAASYGVDNAPALAILGADGDPGIRFVGIPAGFELASLIQAMTLLSAGDPGLRPQTREALTGLDQDAVIKVFVTPTCPYCPRAALTAMQMAMATPRVRAEVVEVMEFPELADAYRVMGVPKIVINDRVEMEGALPEDTFLQAILHAAGTTTTTTTTAAAAGT